MNLGKVLKQTDRYLGMNRTDETIKKIARRNKLINKLR